MPVAGGKQNAVRSAPVPVVGPAPSDCVAPCWVTAQFTTTAEPAIPPFEVETALALWTTIDCWRISCRSYSAEPNDVCDAACASHARLSAWASLEATGSAAAPASWAVVACAAASWAT